MPNKKIIAPRFERLLKHTDISKKGIEIAPYYNPILPKTDGHNVFILDVFDIDRLRANFKDTFGDDKENAARIEPVDFVGDACDLGAIITKAGMAGQFSYVLSSHNFEHLANPIKFLQGVGAALETGGVLSMVIPDYRCCFDRFRMPTRLSDWLVAYHTDKKQPSAADWFDFINSFATMQDKKDHYVLTDLQAPYPPAPYLRCKDLRGEYQQFCKELESPSAYKDTHCNVLFPELLELYLRDLRHLGLIDLELIIPPKTIGAEFFVYLKKVAIPPQTSEEDHRKIRQDLLIKIMHGMGEGGFRRKKTIFTFFKSLNHKRLARRRASLSNKLQPKEKNAK